MRAIVNAKIILEDGILWNGTVLWEGDKILSVGKTEEVAVPADAEVIDAGGLYVAPGLVDIHNHGCTEAWFYEDPIKCCEVFLRHGVTTVLPTFLNTMSKETMIEGAEKIRKLSKTGIGRVMDGLYMEGPFMRLSGGFSSLFCWDEEIHPGDYREMIAAFGDMVRIWAIDPGRAGIEDFMRYAKEKKPEVIFAHGHSHATAGEIRTLRHYGVKVRTHLFDSGKLKGRCQGTFGAGGDTFALYEPDMYAELIVDRIGIHVEPDLVRMVIRMKGVDRICLISDHTSSHGGVFYKNSEKDGIWYGPDLNYDDRGKLAGSLMNLDEAVKNVMTHTGYGLCHAVKMASLTPARLLGIDDRVGSIEAGKTANLLLMDDAVNIRRVFLEGEEAVDEAGRILI